MMKKILQAIFSITNYNNHKVIAVLGIKIKLKIKKPIEISAYKIQGENNKIIIVEENGDEIEFDNKMEIEGIKIRIIGNNCLVKLNKPFNLFDEVFIEIESNNATCEIGKNCHIEKIHFRLKFGENQKCIIGNNCFFCGGSAIVLDENSSLFIGENCLFAGGLNIWGSDGHSILDKDTYEILNIPQNPIKIGSHCWFGMGCTILKDSIIGDDTIIAWGSIIRNKFVENNVILAGRPAKIVRKNITWNDKSPYYLLKELEKGDSCIKYH